MVQMPINVCQPRRPNLAVQRLEYSLSKPKITTVVGVNSIPRLGWEIRRPRQTACIVHRKDQPAKPQHILRCIPMSDLPFIYPDIVHIHPVPGDKPDRIKKTLNGSGDIHFKNGAVKGMDILAMVQNVPAAFGLTEKSETPAETKFSELHSLFNIKQGVLETSLTPAQLRQAEELFLTNSAIGACPVLQLEGRPLGDGRPGAVTKDLSVALS